MDSPLLQSSQLQRIRTNSNLSLHSVDSRGAVRKRSLSRSRSVSTSQADRLYRLTLEPSYPSDGGQLPPTSIAPQWLTPQHSPQPQLYSEHSLDSFPLWNVPTPPRSDSGAPSVDANEVPVTTDISTTYDFSFEQPTASAEMSSLGFLLPSQYGSSSVEAEPNSYTMDQNYIPPMRMSQPAATSGAVTYTQTVSSSPSLYQSRTIPSSNPAPRRYSEFPNVNQEAAYGHSYRRISNPYDSMASNDYSMSSSQSIPSISGLTHSPQPPSHPGGTSAPGMMPQYSTSVSRSPSLYDSPMYAQQFSTAHGPTQAYGANQSLSYPPPFVGSSVNEVMTKPLASDSSIRVLNQRPKPQCWEHGCNGRQFSTFSNLLRHQREKSGTASKSYCPRCGAEFTRTTARNGHLAHDKCTKTRRASDDDDTSERSSSIR
ncbi:hypothetical protein LTR37_007025 [Vermiconidia calcicola]|uniref:Uncharacterized protein n=1 Tax=Vermiconidia calcicola TaxID=1690605 RepID=A0ACC3NG62_9PEZI|nr:hypothetical protein LTR37_007025 [Vermiconidia calcicola]